MLPMKNVFILWLLLAPCLASLGAQLPTDSLSPAPASAPVLLMPRDTLFRVYGRVGPFGPQERAEAIQRRLQQLLDNPLFVPESLSCWGSAGGLFGFAWS